MALLWLGRLSWLGRLWLIFKMAVDTWCLLGKLHKKISKKPHVRTELNYWDLKYVLIEWNDALKINMKLWKPEILDVKQCSTAEAESLHSLATYQASAISYFKKLDSLPDDKFIVYMYINLFFIKQFCWWCFSSKRLFSLKLYRLSCLA